MPRNAASRLLLPTKKKEMKTRPLLKWRDYLHTMYMLGRIIQPQTSQDAHAEMQVQ